MTHICHHPNCTEKVPARLHACRKHWFQLPQHLRDRIWATYRPGQERDKKPSDAYREAVAATRAFWLATEEKP